MVWCKQKSIISNIAIDKKFNIADNKTVDAYRKQNTAVNKKLYTVANKAINANKKQDNIVSK